MARGGLLGLTIIIIFFYIGLKGQPLEMLISPHVALLAKTLDTPALSI